MQWINRLILLIALAALIAGGYYWYKQASKPAAASFRTASVTRGDLVASIGATGTVEPEQVIDVGAQVAGQILVFGKDVAGKPIDYGSAVEAGMVLAKLDDAVYVADVTQAQAQLDQAKAGITRAKADVEQLKARLLQAQRDWDRARKLGPSDALSQASYDSYQSAFEVAVANVAVGEASIKQAEATQVQAQATLDRANRNLGFCTITSPVKGVIIDRRVNIGQTVVASLNAPSLFLIAQDLRRMVVWIAVNEADIGNIHAGQHVTFTVDALPGQRFDGTVHKVRLNATFTSNVVTYTVEVTTDNSEGKLLPYLTANAQFETGRREEVLMVPNAALRYTPATSSIAPGYAAEEQPLAAPTTRPHSGTTRPGGHSGATTRRSAHHAEASASSGGTLWVRDSENTVRPVQVKTGLTDGASTEVSGEEVTEGMEIVIGEQVASAARPAGSANPFVPQIPSRRPR